jgi:hypothetical protein
MPMTGLAHERHQTHGGWCGGGRVTELLAATFPA